MDYELQELCTQIPHRLRRGPHTDKWLLREALKELLPESVIKSAKAPFRAPARWFVAPDVLERELSDESVEVAGLVEVDAVRELRERSTRKGYRGQEELYSLYVLHTWHRRFVREPTTTRPH
jgi:asparagine synthase (glutamine-hydrolysing)